MNNVDQSLAELAQTTGLPELAFDAGSNLSLVFNKPIEINIARVSLPTIELCDRAGGTARGTPKLCGSSRSASPIA